MPPSKRPEHDRTGSSAPAAISDKGRTLKTGELGEKMAKKLAKGTIAIEEDEVYDMSLSKAIYWTVWRSFWFAVTLNGLGSQCFRDIERSKGQAAHAWQVP